MNQLENCQARYRSNTWMGRTRTDGPDEVESWKFDCTFLHTGIMPAFSRIRLLRFNIAVISSVSHDLVMKFGGC